jgi:tetratricopeptide (TPR) repeat protein
VVLALLMLAVAAVSVHAQSDDDGRARAKAAFEHGVADYAAGRYEQALINFQEAYRIRPHPLVNVNLANCYDKLGKPLQAIALFEHFLESDTGTPEQRLEVKTALERLSQQAGKILLRVAPDGATVVFDQGEPLTSPVFEPVPLEAGRHTLTVQLSGYKTVQRDLIVKGGTTLELTIGLEAEGPPVLAIVPHVPEPAPTPGPAELPAPRTSPETPEAPSAAPEGRSGLPTGVWVLGGITLVLAGAATVSGVLALGANKDFKQYKTARFDPAATAVQRVQAYNDASDAANRARKLALATDVLLAGTAVAATVTIYLIATRDRSKPEPQASVAPLATPHMLGMQASTSF